MDARGILCVLGLLISIPMACVVFVAGARPGGRKPFLALVFLEAGLFFLSSIVPAKSTLGLALGFGSTLYGLPSLYLSVRETIGEPRRRFLAHYIPAIANVPIGVGLAFLYASRLQEGMGAALYLSLLQLGQTIQLIAYGRAALVLCGRKKTGREVEWSRRVVIAVLFGYGAFLAIGWVSFGKAIASELLGRPLGIVAGLDLFSLLIAVLVAWTLSLCALWGKDYTSKTSRDERKYGGRPLSADMADELVRRTRALLVSERDLSSPDVAPRQLAGRLGEPYHLLSRAVNEREGISISDLISEYRVDRAKGMLEAEPDLTILDIALDSGFQAKSTFNEVFKKRVGMSPRRYRSGRETSSH